ncbi:pyrimidine 5'-nucleotidase [Alphaproteobacteria bacterium LSUCC0684]
MIYSERPFAADRYTGWIFDLDNTIYPAASGLFQQVSDRMTLFIQNLFDLDRNAAHARQKDLFRRYGTTASGLMKEYGMDPAEFMAFVHDIDLSELAYDPELDERIGALPGRKVIFTNGTTRHATRILDAYGIRHHFDYIYDIIESQHRPKPDPAIYREMLLRTGIDPEAAVMIEDMAVNLKPAAEMGITTVLLKHDLENTKDELGTAYIDFIAHDLKTFLRQV